MPLYMIPFGSKIIFSTARIRYNLLEVLAGWLKVLLSMMTDYLVMMRLMVIL